MGMTKITTDFVGNETEAETKTRLTAILEAWQYAPSAYTTWGDARSDLNELLPSSAFSKIGATERAGSFLPKLNFLNDPQAAVIDTFAGGIAGFMFDFTDDTTVFSDTGGTTPAVAGDSAARVNDVSGNGLHSTQANAALRGKKGKAPKVVRNLLVLTEFPNGLSDAPLRGGLLTAATFAGVSGNTGLAFGHDGSTSTFAYKTNVAQTGTEYNLSALIEMDDGLAPWFGSSNNTSATNDFAFVLAGTPINPLTYSVDLVDGSVYSVSCIATTPGTIAANNTGIFKIAGNSARTFKTSGWQLSIGATLHPYQRVGASDLDVTESGVQSFGFYRPDLSDDVLPLTVPDINGDILIAGKKGIHIAAITASAGAFAIGPTTYTGGSAGVLAAVGDICGIELIDKTTSAEERARLVAYYQARGAGALL
jgi:hypothetical protein